MINVIYGDLLDARNTLILHQVNCQGVMGSGIAASIKNDYPEVFFAYRKSFEEGNLLLGSVTYEKICDKTYIVNCASQNRYLPRGIRHTDYDAARFCFIQANDLADEHDIDTISFPLYGCGLGGGDWDVMVSIIGESFPDKTLNLYIKSK